MKCCTNQALCFSPAVVLSCTSTFVSSDDDLFSESQRPSYNESVESTPRLKSVIAVPTSPFASPLSGSLSSCSSSSRTYMPLLLKINTTFLLQFDCGENAERPEGKHSLTMSSFPQPRSVMRSLLLLTLPLLMCHLLLAVLDLLPGSSPLLLAQATLWMLALHPLLLQCFSFLPSFFLCFVCSTFRYAPCFYISASSFIVPDPSFIVLGLLLIIPTLSSYTFPQSFLVFPSCYLASLTHPLPDL
ncbi:hypothetical protein MHYP_G00219700 [Metynnis hypsauchen]